MARPKHSVNAWVSKIFISQSILTGEQNFLTHKSKYFTYTKQDILTHTVRAKVLSKTVEQNFFNTRPMDFQGSANIF